MSDLWKAARQQVADFEGKTAELSLLLSTEKARLEAMAREVKKQDEERAEILERLQRAEERKTAARGQLVQLQAAASKAAKDGTVLHKHVDLLRSSREDAVQQMEVDRQRFQQHLDELRSKLRQFGAHFEAGEMSTGEAMQVQ